MRREREGNSDEENNVGSRHDLRWRSPPGAGRRGGNRIGGHDRDVNQLSVAEPTDDGGLAISVFGVPLVQRGNSTAITVGPNLAIAYNNSQASAAGFGNIVIAGNNSNAGEAIGVLNRTTANNNSTAVGLFDVGNHTVAENGSTVQTGAGFFNTVRATNNSSVSVTNARFNTVRASDGSTVDISGDANRVTARCGGSVVFSAQSNQIVTSAPCETG